VAITVSESTTVKPAICAASFCWSSIQCAGRPKAGSVVAVPISGVVMPPGLMARYMPGKASPSPTMTPRKRDAVGAGLELQVVAHVHGRRQKAHLLRKLAAHALDAVEQVALAVLVHQRNQAVAQFQPELVDRLQVVPRGLAVVAARWSGHGAGRLRRWLARQHPGAISQHRG